ncbi:MAG: hypothetical protein HND45_04910 [Chloroflexi bacterium]|nr:hypothetical protein [Chloroflexota bacterium]NOG75221.1 hypothetical protein [Chloroflexota bacterium]GIK10542.1 MAG: hypothetical protein BroJett001_26080 [Chloroflexota bacterium]
MENIDDYCRWLREVVANSEKNPDDADLSYRAIDGFEEAMKSRMLVDVDLDKITIAAKCRRVGPREIGRELLLAMLDDFPQIESTWRNLSISSLAHERWLAVSAIQDERISFDLAKELAEKALDDKSSKVRLCAVDRVFVRYIESLLPAIKNREKVEKDRKVLQYIHWVLNHMEQT